MFPIVRMHHLLDHQKTIWVPDITVVHTDIDVSILKRLKGSDLISIRVGLSDMSLRPHRISHIQNGLEIDYSVSF